MFLERTPPQQPQVEILESPALDPMRTNPSVTCLYKQHGGKSYLFAVNACPVPVKVRFTMPNGLVRTKSFKPFGTLATAL